MTHLWLQQAGGWVLVGAGLLAFSRPVWPRPLRSYPFYGACVLALVGALLFLGSIFL